MSNNSITTFESWKEFYGAMLESAKNLTDTYDSITTHPNKPGGGENIHRDKYFKNFDDIVKEKYHVRFRRIVTVTSVSKFEWIENNLIAHVNRPNFNIAYFDQMGSYFPLVGLIIFDKKEIYLTTVFDPQADSIYIKSTDNALISFFSDYFDRLWAHDISKKIKLGNFIDEDIINDLKKQFGVNKQISKKILNPVKYFNPINLNNKKKKECNLAIFQFDYREYLTLNNGIYVPNIEKEDKNLKNIEKVVTENDVDIICLPECSINESSLDRLVNLANQENILIIGGTFYDKDRYNISPIIIPNNDIYFVEKHNIPPVETSPARNSGAISGGKGNVIIDSEFGTIGVLICADFLDSNLRVELLGYNLDFLFIVALNSKSDEFFKMIEASCISALRENYKPPYIIYCNSILKDKSDGQSSIFGVINKNEIDKLRIEEFKPDDNYSYKLVQIAKEGIILTKLRLDFIPRGINTIKDQKSISNTQIITL